MRLNHPVKKLKLIFMALSKIDNWWDYFLDYFGLKKGIVNYRIGGRNILTRAGTIDKSIFTEVALEKLYFPKWLSLPEGAVIIDVGAHIGIFSMLASSKFKNSRIYSIEPSSDNFRILTKQKNLNKANAELFNIALTDKDGEMKLYQGEHSARGSLTRKEGKGFEIVKTKTLRRFFSENKIEKCDLMKMDIEGGEYSVLYSTPNEIFDKIDRIFIEIHKIDGEKRGDLIRFIQEKGFKTKYKDEDFVYALR